MKLNLATVCAAVALFFTACATTKEAGNSNIKYLEAQRYFFNNNASVPSSPITTTQEEFDKLYGAATVMGRNGRPTTIDFSKQFTIGIVLPETNDNTEIHPGKLTSDGDMLTLHYSTTVTDRNMSWTMRPMSLIVVDRKYLKTKCRLQQDK